MKEKIYISGPISGHPIDEVKRRFSAWKRKLTEGGYKAVIPTENGLPPDASWLEHMKRDIELLNDCDAIFMLEGWQKSRGCQIEFNIAVEAKIPIIFEINESDRIHQVAKGYKGSEMVC
jgi:hypothetical protein